MTSSSSGGLIKLCKSPPPHFSSSESIKIKLSASVFSFNLKHAAEVSTFQGNILRMPQDLCTVGLRVHPFKPRQTQHRFWRLWRVKRAFMAGDFFLLLVLLFKAFFESSSLCFRNLLYCNSERPIRKGTRRHQARVTFASDPSSSAECTLTLEESALHPLATGELSFDEPWPP